MFVRSTPGFAKTEVICSRGMVTANHQLAANAGAKILARGGNAIDAAIATSFAIGVAEPASSGIGGRGYMVIHLPGDGISPVIDGHERAPRGASADMYTVTRPPNVAFSDEIKVFRERGQVENNANTQGPLSVAVPGVIGALAVAHERFGSLRFREILEPAIELAKDGFEVTLQLATQVAAYRRNLSQYPDTAKIFMRDGFPLRAGDRFVQEDLGRTLERLAEHGPQEFYQGSIARAISDEVQRLGGVLSHQDLKDFRPRIWEHPLSTTFRGHHVQTLHECAGGITLIQILNILDQFDVSTLTWDDPEYLHLLIETARIAFHDRFPHLDDPAFAQVPLNGLISREFAANRAKAIGRQKASRHVNPGNPWEFNGSDGESSLTGDVDDFDAGDGDTTHFSVVDRDHGMVSMTQSIIGPFGSSVVVPGTGILLNNAMHNFNPVPAELGSIAPWKRARHYGAPTIVLNPDGTPKMTIGGAGGTKIVTGLAQILDNVLQREWSLQDAVAAPRVHNEGWDTMIDARFGGPTISVLRGKGHRLAVEEEEYARPSMSRINGIMLSSTGAMSSGVDIFSDAGAAGIPDGDIMR